MDDVVQFPLTIYYDSACPVCRGEMSALKRLDAANRLVLVDCAGGVVDDACRAAGLGGNDLLGAIHARDASGRWLAGVDVFVVAYRAAGLHALAWLFGERHLRAIWDRLYPWIARHRYALSRVGLAHLFRLLPHRPARSAACDDGVCAPRQVGARAYHSAAKK